MSVSKNKPTQKLNKKSQSTQNMDTNQDPEIQVIQLNQKRKRNRFKNIDWEYVLDFDTLAENQLIYEAPWMQTSTNKRKKIFKQFDKSIPDLNLKSSMNDVNSILQVETSSSSGNITKKSSKRKTANNNITKSKEEKQQKKNSLQDNSSNCKNKTLKTDEFCNKENILNLLQSGIIEQINSDNEQIFESPQQQSFSKIMTNSSNQIEQQSTLIFFEENMNENIKQKSNSNTSTKTSIKLSPTSFRLSDEMIRINQYDDSDASTREEDHHYNQTKRIIDTSIINNENKRLTRRGERLEAIQKKINEEKINTCEGQENQLIKQTQNENSSISKSNMSKKLIQIDTVEENMKTNCNTKKNKSLAIIYNEDKIKSAAIDDIDSITSQQLLKSDEKSIQSSPDHYIEEMEQCQYQKSVFSNSRPHHPNDRLSKVKALLASCQLPSDQSMVVDEEINAEDSGLENSNNNVQILQQQEFDQDQQQIPHLYIRNQHYAIKVGTKYQAVIPEIGSYNQQNKPLERLITQQKVWGSDWILNNEKTIKNCSNTLKQWYGHRRNQELCLNHLMLLGFDETLYKQFLEEDQDYFLIFIIKWILSTLREKRRRDHFFQLSDYQNNKNNWHSKFRFIIYQKNQIDQFKY